MTRTGARLSLAAMVMGSAGLVRLAVAATPNETHRIRIAIPAECMSWYYGPQFAADGTITKSKGPKYVLWNPDSAKPFTFKDPRTSISFYVESDGRHLAAIDSVGKLLWVRNPFEDSHLCPYRNPRPSISSISTIEISPHMAEKMRAGGIDPNHNFVEIKFDSSLFGVVDEANGDFQMWGQN
jgi:hypothetical protein